MKGPKVMMAGLVALALCVGMVAGCGDGDSSGGSADRMPYVKAKYVDDGAPKYFENQEKCPVCGTAGELQGHVYADVDGKRIYFDKEECKKKFQQDRSKYLEKLDKRKQETSGKEK